MKETKQAQTLFEKGHFEALADSIATRFPDSPHYDCSDYRLISVRGILPALMKAPNFDEDRFREVANAQLTEEKESY